jgi:acetyl-CoA carboxylase biotin carboxylase subunit
VIARGDTRDAACDRMIGALEALRCEGVPTTAPMHLAILRSRAFREHRIDIPFPQREVRLLQKE